MSTQKVNYQITGENLLSKVLRQIDNDANKAEQSINNISKGGVTGGQSNKGMMGSVLSANLLTNAISNAASAVYDFGKDSIRAFGQQEQFLTSLKTMFHGNGDEAKFLNEQLKGFAKSTPFELTEIQDATKMMIAYGSTSGSVVNEMRMLGDVSSGVGAPLKDVAYLYGTLRTQGRAFSKDIYQFTGRGIPIVKELAKQFGVTDDKVMKLAEDGKIGFAEVEKALKSMTSEGGQFFGMMDEQSQTLNGRISNLGDSWEQLKVNIAKSQSGIINETVNFMSGMVSAINRKQVNINFLEEAINKHGTKEVGFFDKYFGMGSYDDLEKKSQDMQSFINMSNSGQDSKVTIRWISDRVRKLKEDQKKGWIDNESYINEMALYTETFKSIAGKMNLLAKKDEKTGEGKLNTNVGNPGKSEKLGTGVTVEAHAPKNQYITINGGLVHQMTIESMDGSTPTGEIKDQISTVLVELLNDAYQAQV